MMDENQSNNIKKRARIEDDEGVADGPSKRIVKTPFWRNDESDDEEEYNDVESLSSEDAEGHRIIPHPGEDTLDILPWFVYSHDLVRLQRDNTYRFYDVPNSAFRIAPDLAHKATLSAVKKANESLKDAKIAVQNAEIALNNAKMAEESAREGKHLPWFRRIVIDGIENIETEKVKVTIYKRRGDEDSALKFTLSHWKADITLDE